MKENQNFILREIAGEFMLIPVGAAAEKFNGLITLNETGAILFKALSQDVTLEALVDAVTAEYDIDRNTATADAEEFLQYLQKIDALVE